MMNSAHLASTSRELARRCFSHSVPYVVLNEPDAYRIVFNLFDETDSRLYCSLNKVESKLIVIVERDMGESALHYPCVFKAPADADLNDVQIQSKGGVHVISVTKRPYVESALAWSACELPTGNHRSA